MTSLSQIVLEEIDTIVQGGFEDRTRMLEIFLEEMYEPGELPPEDVEAAIDAAIEAHEAAKANWPSVTDCDRLDDAFRALGRKGVIALQNAGYTQNDGYEDFRAALASSSNPSEVRGYCYFHGQDLEHAVRGDGLYLAFGPSESEEEETSGAVIGKLVASELRRVGFRVEWGGTFDKRIYLPEFAWQRR